MDPPPYDASESQSHAQPLIQPTHSIADLYTLILANAAIIKPRKLKDDATVELVVARTDAGTPIRVPAPGVAFPTYDAAPGVSPMHFAMLLIRSSSSIEVAVLLQGQPAESPEKALEWMWERTQALMVDVIRRHGARSNALGCCGMCAQALKNRQSSVLEFRTPQ